MRRRSPVRVVSDWPTDNGLTSGAAGRGRGVRPGPVSAGALVQDGATSLLGDGGRRCGGAFGSEVAGHAAEFACQDAREVSVDVFRFVGGAEEALDVPVADVGRTGHGVKGQVISTHKISSKMSASGGA